MQIFAGTTAQQLPISHEATVLVQNLGPGNVYVDSGQPAAVATGIKLAVGSVIDLAHPENEGGGGISVLADAANTDVRFMAI